MKLQIDIVLNRKGDEHAYIAIYEESMNEW